MAKTDILTQGYADGYDIALRVAKEAAKNGKDIIKALECERRNRTALGIKISLTSAEWSKEFDRAIEVAYRLGLIISLSVLWGDFGWGGIKRLPAFTNAYFNYVMAIGKGDTNVDELIGLLAEKVDAHIDIKSKDMVVDFRKRKGDDIYK